MNFNALLRLGCVVVLSRWWPPGWHIPGLCSLSGKTSYHQISRSIEAARLDVTMIVSLWNLTGISAALLPRCLSIFIAVGKVYTRISRLRNFTRSCGKTPVRLTKKRPGLGLFSLRHRLIGIGIPIINLRRSSDRRRFIMGFLYP